MKYSMFILFILSIILTCQGLEPGDKAPELKANVWINGNAVNPAQPDGTTTYVIEFWATWCPPCKRSIPQLNKLFDKYKDKRVVLVGVTSESEETVRPFIKKMNMKYTVAIDTNHTFSETYMAGILGIPHAFIIDTNGMVAWSGHPSDGLEDSLSEVVAGTYNREKVKAAQGEDEELQNLLLAGDFDKAVDLLDTLLAKDRKNIEYYELKISLLVQLGKAEKAKRLYQDMFEEFSDSAEDLNTVSWMAVTSPFELCNLDLAWKAATRAAELSKRETSAILDTLARVYYAVGLLDQAVKEQKEAVEKCSDTKERESLKATLNYYTSAASLRNRIGKEGGAKKTGP